MKKCRNCKIEKKSEEFYARASNSDGLYSYCKECTLKKNRRRTNEQKERSKNKNREYKEKNRLQLNEKSRIYYYKNREKVLERSEKFRKLNKEKISINEALRRIKDENRFQKNRDKHLRWSKKNREKLNEYQRKWYNKNKEKRRAHVILSRAIKSGKIMRPVNCSECKKESKLDGHHIDYNKPLDVIWICRACHSRKSPRTVIK